MDNTPIDISRTISPLAAVYPGDEALGSSALCDTGDDSPCRITSLENWTTHFLTHVDPPRHFVPDGETLDQIPLNRFFCPTVVVAVEGPSVEPGDVPTEGIAGKAILFKTRNSSLPPTLFHEDHAYISADAVAALLQSGPGLVGFDYLSVDKFGDESYPAHRGLLGAGILILEGLDLSNVDPGEYQLSALPLKISDADGSPVRAVLFKTG